MAAGVTEKAKFYYARVSMHSVFMCAPVRTRTLFPLALDALVADRTE